MLYDKAIQNGAVVLAGKRAVGYEHLPTGRGVVNCADGSRFEGSLVVGADGQRGLMKDIVAGEMVESEATGDAAYRALLPAEVMDDPIFASLELRKYATTWLGPGRHLVSYYVSGGAYYNVVILVPDNPGEESWKKIGDMNALRKQFVDWDPRVQKLLELVDNSYVWKLRDRPALKRWLHPEGNLVLLGDAAHPMLPYVAQGAASAVEDAAALATCLDFINEKTGRDLRNVLNVYESLRKPRTQGMREAARRNMEYFHMPDGIEQQDRDAALSAEATSGSTPNQLNDAEKLKEMYGYDVVKEVKKHFN
ncbi:hypothetical protein VE03_06886 [Pseudogymnoascus sp. 23342-1-I1]|nr:hypothetical protein VE03_06886 [Pseudogymnoascus sp. 23342-1-I1]